MMSFVTAALANWTLTGQQRLKDPDCGIKLSQNDKYRTKTAEMYTDLTVSEKKVKNKK